MPNSPIKTPSSVRISAKEITLPVMPTSSVAETPSVAPAGLLPSVFNITPPTTLPRRRSIDDCERHPAKRIRTLEEAITDEEEGDGDIKTSRTAATPTRAVLTLATPNTTNLLSPVSRRPRLGRSFSASSSSVALESDDGFPVFAVKPTSAEMVHTLSAPVVPSSSRQTSASRSKSLTELPAYMAYLARQRRENGDDGNSIWSPDVEEAFMEAIRKIPKVGRRKITVNGRPCGRNELISDFILRKTGKVRTRKQVSSHIQVLKHLLKDDVEFMNLVADTPTKSTSQHMPIMVTSGATAHESEGQSGFVFPRRSSTSPLNVRQPLGTVTLVPQHHLPQVLHTAKLSPSEAAFHGPSMIDQMSHISPTPKLELPTRLDDSSSQSLLYDVTFIQPLLSPPTSQDPNATLAVPQNMVYTNPRIVPPQQLPRSHQQTVGSYITDMTQNLGMWIECDPIESPEDNHTTSLYPTNEIGIWSHDL
ncbi:TEA/ATTS domain family-domain-containing protein [Lipomyces tetrasporus]|uniref:TEA/ATTS domain family-domain-containing protein n=1 Tax=Lipomyces tetrasporus TaxID=54092 RepID=A0AAD7QZI0_9ASCO|nr:TEA/ATTS domain family-domain-containing protein [Lipomyces tetrasporus]KAJ8104250.1 TEA/ATTS domain family-domain-containing protein [Lipomyces tetrasporus]